MANCEMLPTCPFFNDRMDLKPGLTALYKARYCRGDNSECGRHIVFVALGRAAVPCDMYPNDRLAALSLVRRAHRCDHDESAADVAHVVP